MTALEPEVSPQNWKLILATDVARGIGYKNSMPWPRLSDDFKHFRTVTTKVKDPAKQNAVVMGRKTWESFGGRGPLPNRLNIIISTTMEKQDDSRIRICKSFEEAIEVVKAESSRIEKVFVIGGVDVYMEAIRRGASTIWLTVVQDVFLCDRYMPPDYLDNYFLNEKKSSQFKEKNITFTISKFIKKKF